MSVIPKVKSLIRGQRDALRAWNVLKRAYEDEVAVNHIGLLRKLILIKLEDCTLTDDYVDKKITAAEKISGTGLNVPDEWLGLLLLARLPKRYESMTQTIKNSSINSKAKKCEQKFSIKYLGDENLYVKLKMNRRDF